MNKDIYLATMPFAINESSVTMFIILFNDETRAVINQYKKVLDADEHLHRICIEHDVINASVILVSGIKTDFHYDFEKELKSIQNKIEPVNPVANVSDIIDIELFEELMFAPELNVAENIQIILTSGGLYVTSQWETDFIETTMFDYIDII